MSDEGPVKRRRGRPSMEGAHNVKRDAAGNIIGVKIAQSSNFDALAAQVEQRRSDAKDAGKRLTIKKAVEDEIRLAIQRNNDWPEERRPESWKIVREGQVAQLIANALREVRRRLPKEDTE